MSKKNGRKKPLKLSVTIAGRQRLMTLEELKAESRPTTAEDLRKMRELGKDLFRSDEEFEAFQQWLRRSRQRG